MKRVAILLLAAICPFVAGLSSAGAQERTLGLLINEDDAFVGYTLFAPMPYNVTYLIDNNGLLVHSWESEYRPRFVARLLESSPTASLWALTFRSRASSNRWRVVVSSH